MKDHVDDAANHGFRKTFGVKVAGNLDFFLPQRHVFFEPVRFFKRRLLGRLQHFVFIECLQQRSKNVGIQAFGCQFLGQAPRAIPFGQPLPDKLFRIGRIVDELPLPTTVQHLLNDGLGITAPS